MEEIEKAVIQITGELAKSDRWLDPDRPGSAHIKELFEYLNDGKNYQEFYNSEVGKYYTAVIDSYLWRFNDDLLPYEIIGLKLEKAKEFIQLVNQEVSSNGLSRAIPNLKTQYAILKNQQSGNSRHPDIHKYGEKP